jgi:S1-C subfamily serine protease
MNLSKLLAPFLVIATLIWGGLWIFAPKLVDRISYARESARQRAIIESLPKLKQADGLSMLYREVSKAVKPAVVEVRVSKTTEIPGQRFSSVPEAGAIGSGVVVDRKNGYVVTNEHVISGADSVSVVLADGRKLRAEWVRSDRMTDLAVIKIPPDKLMDIPLGDSDEMEVGDLVLAVGSPIRLPQTVTFGGISAKGRMYGQPDKYQNYLQTDAAINHGNSGGPLINMAGEIIGINVAIVSTSGASAGLGLAIPSNTVKRVTRQLIESGKVARGFIGLAFKKIDKEDAAELKLPHTNGALVTMVAPNGPGDVAGIKPGDFILSADSQIVVNSQKFRHIIAAIKPGTVIPIELYRDGETIILSVKIILQPENMERAFDR